MRKIAVCVVTYNHAETVNDVLMHCIKDYYELGIDIYYYDGSSNNETQKVINRYIEQGFDNLFYIHEEEEDRADMIFMSLGLEHEYEYIWISKDRSYCTRETLKKILDVLNNNDDIIFLATLGRTLTDCIYSNPVLFYRDWAWLATSLDITIYRRDSMLKGFSKDKYLHTFGLHYSLLFHRLAELNNVKIQVICNNIDVITSKFSDSMWTNQVFKVWKEDWILVNEKLPECYNEYKDYIIRKATGLPWILGGKKRLLELHEKGILVPDRLPEVKPNWERVSDIPYSIVEKIANGKYDEKHDLSMIPVLNSRTYELINRIIELVTNGTILSEQIPYADICQLLKGEVGNRYILNTSGVDMPIIGAIEDICSIAEKHHLSQREAANVLQAVVLLSVGQIVL